MADIDLTRAELGYAITDENGNEIWILQNSGIPGGDTAEQDDAPRGSIYVNRDNGRSYSKDSSGTGSDKWVQQANADDIAGLASNVGAWRDPAALVKDDSIYANLAAAVTAANIADTVDGVTIQAGDYILFTGITGENSNTFEVGGSTGAWTFTEYPQLQDGDATWIKEGTSVDTQWNYNGTAWAQMGGSNATELGYIRTFIGKDNTGSELPTYATIHQISAQNVSLETAISDIDGNLGTDPTDVGVILTSNTINQNIENLAGTLRKSYTDFSQTGITSQTMVNEVNVSDVQVAVWDFYVREVSTPTRIIRMRITAMHNGTLVADATGNPKAKRDMIMRTQGNISGFSWDVDLNGTGITQTMRLLLSSTSAVNVYGFVREIQIGI